MNVWEGKKILLGITGGIAAYKMYAIIRFFIQQGAEVKVVLTPEACAFVSKLTLSTLSQNPVYSEFFNKDTGEWVNHVELGMWADVMLIAPCTANTLSQMAHGGCDNLLLACYFSAKCPVYVAPAMDLDMYAHPTTKENIKKLESFGNTIIPAEYGFLASGLEGQGRLASEEYIIQSIASSWEVKTANDFWQNKKVMITAGPTYEAIDPVRFIGNHSTGKMGYALAEKAAAFGAEVILISGPVQIQTKNKNIKVIPVESAREMYEACFRYYDEVDVVIAAAAVADYRVEEIAEEKIKKNEEVMELRLVKNPDILKSMGEQKSSQFLMGFALETENEEVHAQAKLIKKNADAIVLNSLRDAGAGFGKDTNKVKIISRDSVEEVPLMSKQDLATYLLEYCQRKMSGN